MQYWKQAAKQHRHNNHCPNSFYYNITVQLVCSHVNTSSRPLTISFPWQLVDGVMFPWKSISPSQWPQYHLRETGCGTGVASRLCPPLAFKSSVFLCVSAFLRTCVQALPRWHARITVLLPLNSPVSETCISDAWQEQSCLSLRTWEGPDASSQKQRDQQKTFHSSTMYQKEQALPLFSIKLEEKKKKKKCFLSWVLRLEEAVVII